MKEEGGWIGGWGLVLGGGVLGGGLHRLLRETPTEGVRRGGRGGAGEGVVRLGCVAATIHL